MEYEYLTLLSWFAFGWFAHSAYVAWKMNRILRKIAKEHNLSVEEMMEQVSPETKVIKVPYMFTELVNGSIMLYNKETKQFVSQADNLDKLAQNLMEHNKVKMAVVNHNNQMLWFVDGKVQRDIKET
jgi:hypothetical protein